MSRYVLIQVFCICGRSEVCMRLDLQACIVRGHLHLRSPGGLCILLWHTGCRVQICKAWTCRLCVVSLLRSGGWGRVLLHARSRRVGLCSWSCAPHPAMCVYYVW